MKLRGALTKWLFAPAAARRRSSRLELYALDVDVLAAELDLTGEARTLARVNLPALQQTALSAPEAKATQRVEKARSDYVEWASVRLAHLNELLARSDATTVINQAAEADKAFERTASTHLAENATLLEDLATKARRCERELEIFQHRHQLDRDATYPEGSATFLRYSVLALMIVLEGALNAFFFSQGLDSGLLGGFIYAAVLAALNLGTAFVIGKLWIPLAVHRRTALRVLGVIAVPAAIFWMASVGLAIAHLRDALTAEMAEPAVAAWDALRAAPLYLKDVNSWLLLAMSVGFAVGALCDGLSSDDIYPGYGRCARRAQQAREDYLDQLQEVRETLEDMKNEALEDFEEQLRHVQSSIGRYEGIMADKQSTALKLNGAIANADNCLDALLKTFRDANAVERADRARPRYFDLRPNLPELTVPDVDTARDEAALARQRALAAGLIDQAPSIRASIQASFSTQYDMLKPIDEHFATLRVVDEKEPSLAQAA